MCVCGGGGGWGVGVCVGGWVGGWVGGTDNRCRCHPVAVCSLGVWVSGVRVVQCSEIRFNAFRMSFSTCLIVGIR